MDFLVSYYATIHCYTKKVVFKILGQSEFRFQGIKKELFLSLISAIQARNILPKEGKSYLS